MLVDSLARCVIAVSRRPLITPRSLTTSLFRHQSHSAQTRTVEGAAEISHAQFISSASPHSDFNPTQTPHAGLSSSSPWQGKLSPTKTHLFKLILPLPTQSRDKPQPTAFLLHPSQPLSHLSRLIAGSLPPEERNVDISYLALTGQESDLDTHLRHAEEEQPETDRKEGGPHLKERSNDQGRWQEVSWSQSTDLSDFIKQSCLNERFKVVINSGAREGEQSPRELTLEVVIPSFASRTTFLRKRLLSLTKDLDGMTRQKKGIDNQAHRGARKLIVAGLVVGVGYWISIVRYTFFTDAGWDLMEPVTWTVGFGTLLSSAAFLAYHNREVSYSSILDLSVTARQRSLYEKHGLDIDRWTEMVSEAKTIRKEIIRIAADYDIEWKGELDNLEAQGEGDRPRLSGSDSTTNHDSSVSSEVKGEEENPKIDIDKTIDEADELASSSEEQRDKEKAAQRKGEVIDSDRGKGSSGSGKPKQSSADRGREKADELAQKKTH